ncbi:MAG: hypothetical protein LBT15_06290, partial [Synergistaceae bacterium]|nr:hypothetical protein [Synergistaceae bacterium]
MDMNDESRRDDATREALAAWPWRAGMLFYRTGIDAFFAAGGLRRLKKKYRVGIDERMGIFGPDVPRDALWVHSVSVGEVQSAMSLLEAAKADLSLPCILSTVTTTGRTMAENLTAHVADRFIYNPWDTRTFVRRALDTLTPRAYVAMETERWPTMLYELHRRGIPAFLVNGRLSDKSAGRLRRTRTFWRGVLCCFDRLMVRFDSDRENFLSLGVPEEKIFVTGDCKIDAMFSRRRNIDASKWERLRGGDSGRPLFLAASTHEGEEEIVLRAFRTVRQKYPRARLIIAPRHPERARPVATTALSFGRVALLSDLSDSVSSSPSSSGASEMPDIVVVDKIGVLFDLCSIADAAFVGGRLVSRGGQNLMEPALFGIQVTHGPDMSNFPDAGRMDALGAARVVHNAPQLAKAWLASVNDAARLRVRQACKAWFDTVGGASDRSWRIVREYLPNREMNDPVSGRSK